MYFRLASIAENPPSGAACYNLLSALRSTCSKTRREMERHDHIVRKSLEHTQLLQLLFPGNKGGQGLPTPNKPGRRRKAKVAVGEQL
jgi:hypothetical protein